MKTPKLLIDEASHKQTLNRCFRLTKQTTTNMPKVAANPKSRPVTAGYEKNLDVTNMHDSEKLQRYLDECSMNVQAQHRVFYRPIAAIAHFNAHYGCR